MINQICFIFFLQIFGSMSSPIFAQSSQIEKDFQHGTGPISSTYEKISQSVQNRILASGLASGTDSINHSVDSLMESLFYSIMDQNLKKEATDAIDLSSNYRRTVHPTAIGKYVIIDKFQLGPDFLKNLGNANGLPLTFHGENGIFVTNVSHSSDAQRKADDQRIGFWNRLFANWLELLPVLTKILPPSFSPQELYDPISYLKTPFLFPSTAEQALSLPVGNIRSYGINSVLGLELETAGRSAAALKESLKLNDLDLKLPLEFFRTGEHKISILRRNKSHVWLALSESRRIGASLTGSLGKNYRILQKLVSWWSGVPAPISVFNFDLENAKVVQIDELFDFDLNKPKAKAAFIKALHGNFQKARELGTKGSDPSNRTGVNFEFYRLTTRSESGLNQERSFYVAQNQKRRNFGAGESQITDPQGELLTLDTEQYEFNRKWNVLVGADTTEFKHKISLPVTRENGRNKAGRLILTSDATSSTHLSASLRLVNNFVDARNFQNSIRLLRRYSGLQLAEVPQIPFYAEDNRRQLIREQALINPMNEIYNKPISPTFLGKMEATSHVYFAHDVLMSLARKDEKILWNSLAKAFELEPKYWSRQNFEKGSPYYANLLGTYLFYPIQLLSIENSYPDIVAEGRRLQKGFDLLRQATEPSDLIQAYEQILDTNHPVELIQTLLEMAQGLPVPSVVGIHSQASERSRDSEDIKSAKDLFQTLNSKVFESQWPTPPLKRNQSVDEKLAKFAPGGYSDSKPTPELIKLKLELECLPGKENTKASGQLVANVAVRKMPINRIALFAYIRLEQHGALNVGRFILSEDIVKFEAELSNGSTKHPAAFSDLYQFQLNGPDGQSGAKYIDQGIANNGSFDLYISLSEDGEIWGAEQSMSFSIDKGLLKKL